MRKVCIAIRREDKSPWEKRVPLTPQDVDHLTRDFGFQFLVQPSPIRIFKDETYRKAGAKISDDLTGADIVLGVKEIPVDEIRPQVAYVCFAHVIKGQSYNMPTLRRFLDRRATLFDYERIVDEQNRRLIFFGRHAGFAGAMETLRALGLRMKEQGIVTPLLELRRPDLYASMEEAGQHIRVVGEAYANDSSLPRPLIFGITGYGNVSKGVQDALGKLPIDEISPSELTRELKTKHPFVQIVFREEDMARPKDSKGAFRLDDYYAHPESYEGRFENVLDRLDCFINAIYWEPRYPRLVTKNWILKEYGSGKVPRLKVIGDISCDIEGGVEVTLRATTIDSPFAVYDVHTQSLQEGVSGSGPVIMSVDNLPCEFSREASESFSQVLSEMLPGLAQADLSVEFDDLNLDARWKRAMIAHRGSLTPPYSYLAAHLPVD